MTRLLTECPTQDHSYPWPVAIAVLIIGGIVIACIEINDHNKDRKRRLPVTHDGNTAGTTPSHNADGHT